MTPRREEKVFAAELTLANLKNDKVAFKDYSQDYDDTFISNYEAKVAQAKALETVEHLLAQGKSITEALYADVDSLKPILLKLEGYVKRAAGLTISPADFGISEVREKIHKKDVEGLDICLSTLISNIDADDNKAALIAKGYKEEDYTGLKNLRIKIDTENVSQAMQDENQAEVVAANKIVYNELNAITKDILDAGKRIFKYSNKTKADEYVYRKIMSKIRHETNSTADEIKGVEESCIVYVNCEDKEGNPVEFLNITIEEYGLVVETDEEGVGYFEKVPTKPLDKVTIIVEGETWLKQILTGQKLEAGGELDIDVVVKAEPMPGI
jgi:hypothetical protein